MTDHEDDDMANAALRIAPDTTTTEAPTTWATHVDTLGQLHEHLREDRDGVCRDLAELEIELHQLLAQGGRRADAVRDRLQALRVSLLRTDTIENVDHLHGAMRKQLRAVDAG